MKIKQPTLSNIILIDYETDKNSSLGKEGRNSSVIYY